jgi:integrase
MSDTALIKGSEATKSPGLQYLAHLAPGSRRTIAQSMKVLAHLFFGPEADFRTAPWWDLRYEQTHAVRAILAETYAPATTNKMIAAIRGVLKQSWRLQLMKGEDYYRAIDIQSVPNHRLPPGRALSEGELAALFSLCAREGLKGAQNAALISLLCSGLRAGEASGLRIEDFNADEGTVKVQGKGGRERSVPLHPNTITAISAWIRARGGAGGFLLCVVEVNKVILVERPLTPNTIANLCHGASKRAGIEYVRPHDLRRTCATILEERGVSIDTIRAYLGHASIRTTQLYLRNEQQRKEKAAKALHIPYLEPTDCSVGFITQRK